MNFLFPSSHVEGPYEAPLPVELKMTLLPSSSESLHFLAALRASVNLHILSELPSSSAASLCGVQLCPFAFLLHALLPGYLNLIFALKFSPPALSAPVYMSQPVFDQVDALRLAFLTS